MDDLDAAPPRANNPVKVDRPDYIKTAIAKRRARQAGG